MGFQPPDQSPRPGSEEPPSGWGVGQAAGVVADVGTVVDQDGKGGVSFEDQGAEAGDAEGTGGTAVGRVDVDAGAGEEAEGAEDSAVRAVAERGEAAAPEVGGA